MGCMYGELIRRARTSRRMGQRELAAVSGIAQPNISAIERDRRVPSAETLRRLLAACGYTLVAEGSTTTLVVPGPDDTTVRPAAAEPATITGDTPIAERVRAMNAVLDASEAIVRARR